MPDVAVYSTASTQMLDYAYFQQASNNASIGNVDTSPLVYTGANMRVPIDFAYSSQGVRTLADFAVTPGTTLAGSIQISAGMAVVTGTSQAPYQGKYIVATYGVVDNLLAIGPAASTTKYHLLVAEVLDKQALAVQSTIGGSPTGSQWRFWLREDTVGYASPAAALAALLPPNAMPIAVIQRTVAQGNTLNQGNITDVRPLCVTTGVPSNFIGGATWKTPQGTYIAQGIINSMGEVNSMYANNIPCVAGRTYTVEAQVYYVISAAAVSPILHIRENNTTGIDIAYWFSGQPLLITSYTQFLRGPYYCQTTGLKQFMVTGAINSGTTGNLTISKDPRAYIAVFDAGLTTQMTAF